MDYEVVETEQAQKICMRDRIGAVVRKVEDFVEDHSEGIYMTILYGGTAIVFGQSIRYMHLLNKSAAKGIFPGYQSR